MSEEKLRAAIGDLLALVVHDLRNPVATISANVSFVKEVGAGDDEDVIEALVDVETALGDLMRGLEQVGWVGRWIAGQNAMEGSAGDLRSAVEAGVRRANAPVDVRLPNEPVEVARAGGAMARVVELLVRNALANAAAETVQVIVRDGPEGVVEIRDAGRAIGEELREEAFTLEGQQILKGRADGRYSRVVGLLAVRTLTDALGARLEADGQDGDAVFRIHAPK